jgi:predicted XRE-type DNA-binding protein
LSKWTAEIADEGNFEKFFRGLNEYHQAVLKAAIETVLERVGIDICSGEWGKSLGKGLYEFRVRRSLDAILSEAGLEPTAMNGSHRQVLLRVFCTFHGDKIVLLLGGYDKKRDSSERRQNQEIKSARRTLDAWSRKKKRSSHAYVSRHILVPHLGGGREMAKKFSDVAAQASETWSEDAKRVGEAASVAFKSEMDDRAALGAEIAALRKARNLTQPQLQTVSGVQQAEISRIEGGLGNPTISTVGKLTHALGGRLSVVGN